MGDVGYLDNTQVVVFKHRIQMVLQDFDWQHIEQSVWDSRNKN